MAMQVHVLCLLQYKHKAKCLMNWYWFPLNPLSNTNNESYPSTPPRLLQIMCKTLQGCWQCSTALRHHCHQMVSSGSIHLWGWGLPSQSIDGTTHVYRYYSIMNHEPHFYVKIYHVQDITCILVSPNSLSHTVSFVLSSIFLVLVLLLMISLKICHWKAAKNDKLLRKKLRGKGDSSQIVQTVPAVDQHCRYEAWDLCINMNYQI